MRRNQPPRRSGLGQFLKKFFLSGFVVFAFIAYVIHERLTNPDASLATNSLSQIISTNQVTSPSETAGLPPTSSASISSSAPTDQPLAQSNSAAVTTGPYKDGTFKGPEIDAYYGLVQVQATIQSGRIAKVQFLEYPSDRRTSVEINNIAVPYLQQEAIQAQGASVDIISGATLTSEAFMMSLQNALSSAKN